MLYHVVGGSFAACGLLAWHRRPESRAGPLMVVTGLLFFVHGTLGRLHSSFAETIGIAVSNYWIITFAALLRLVPGRSASVGCERETRHRRLRRRRGRAHARVDAVRRDSPQPRAGLAEPAGRERDRQERPARSGSPRRSAWRSFSLRAGSRRRAPVRRASAPAAAGALTLLFLGGLILQAVFTEAQSPYLVWPTLVGLVLVPVVFLAGDLANVGCARRGRRPAGRSGLDERPAAAGRAWRKRSGIPR